MKSLRKKFGNGTQLKIKKSAGQQFIFGLNLFYNSIFPSKYQKNHPLFHIFVLIIMDYSETLQQYFRLQGQTFY